MAIMLTHRRPTPSIAAKPPLRVVIVTADAGAANHSPKILLVSSDTFEALLTAGLVEYRHPKWHCVRSDMELRIDDTSGDVG